MGVREDAAFGFFSESVRERRPRPPLEEGIFDPYILKAVFMAGGPGAGKSFVARSMFSGSGVKLLSIDDVYVYLMTKAGKDLRKDAATPAGQALRSPAMTKHNKRVALAAEGRLGLVIDGTGQDYARLAKLRGDMEKIGYDTAMVYVSTSLEIAVERDAQRARRLGAELVSKIWRAAERTKSRYKKLFGKHFMEVANDERLSKTQVVAVLQPKLWRQALKFLSKPVQNPIGRAWVQAQIAAFKGAMPRIGAKL